jgi:hypothetical protein
LQHPDAPVEPGTRQVVAQEGVELPPPAVQLGGPAAGRPIPDDEGAQRAVLVEGSGPGVRHGPAFEEDDAVPGEDAPDGGEEAGDARTDHDDAQPAAPGPGRRCFHGKATIRGVAFP